MIPLHESPCGLAQLPRLMVRGDVVEVRELEVACTDILDVQEAVLLPSVRTGILLALKAVVQRSTVVAGPAFTCSVVHDAMALSGSPLRLLDSSPRGFSIDMSNLPATGHDPYALILSDIYGIPCDSADSNIRRGNAPAFCIWDMAMSLPTPDTLMRLRPNDVALLSFGAGKCLYAGWGGILLSNNSELAGRVRELRSGWMGEETLAVRVRHAWLVSSRTAAYSRILYRLTMVYRLARAASRWRLARGKVVGSQNDSALSAAHHRATSLSREWTEPMTAANRKLALRGLRGIAARIAIRQRQAEMYHRRLQPLGIVRGVCMEALPQSHFPIRVAPGLRDVLRRHLRRHGIDTGTLFPFPAMLPRAKYPNAAQASDEVVLLPLGEQLSVDEAGLVAKRIEEAVRLIPV